jgi:hypothetical protein
MVGQHRVEVVDVRFEEGGLGGAVDGPRCTFLRGHVDEEVCTKATICRCLLPNIMQCKVSMTGCEMRTPPQGARTHHSVEVRRHFRVPERIEIGDLHDWCQQQQQQQEQQRSAAQLRVFHSRPARLDRNQCSARLVNEARTHCKVPCRKVPS